MIKAISYLFIAFTFFIASPSDSFAQTRKAATGQEAIAVIVNQDAITRSDIEGRMLLIALSTGMKPSPELAQRLRPQITDMLIEEAIKNQEAKRLNIKVAPEEIEAGFAQIAAQNNIPPEEFKKMVASSGIPLSTMRDQIEAQLAWGKVVQRQVRPKIDVSDADIDAELAQLQKSIGLNQYRVAQIFLPLEGAKSEAQLQQFAGQLVSELRKQPEAFPKVAQQFSQSASAQQGGDMGWLTQGQIPEELEQALSQLTINQISDPLKIQNAYQILLLKEKRQVDQTALPSREQILEKIGLGRLDRAQRRYYLDLRSSAYIEKRG
jgi:peptidyl-prolyl cis-trans isomerase SurA